MTLEPKGYETVVFGALFGIGWACGKALIRCFRIGINLLRLAIENILDRMPT